MDGPFGSVDTQRPVEECPLTAPPQLLRQILAEATCTSAVACHLAGAEGRQVVFAKVGAKRAGGRSDDYGANVNS